MSSSCFELKLSEKVKILTSCPNLSKAFFKDSIDVTTPFIVGLYVSVVINIFIKHLPHKIIT